jgi:hypothetical protein
VVPHTTGPIAINGAWKERDWPNTALRGQFRGGDGKLARPSSEVRLLRDDTTLYVGMYAADDDLESATDAFDLVVGGVAMRVSVTGKLDPQLPGVVAAVDSDGTIDDKTNRDEEWVVELAIPRELVPVGVTLVACSRCDVPRDTQTPLCGSWQGFVELP